MNLKQRLEKIKELEDVPRASWEHGIRLGLNVSLAGSSVCFTNDGYYVSLEEAQQALEYYVQQFGGKVKWIK